MAVTGKAVFGVRISVGFCWLPGMSSVFRQARNVESGPSARGSSLTWNSTPQTGHPTVSGGRQLRRHPGRPDHSVWHSWDNTRVTQSSERNSRNSQPVRRVSDTQRERDDPDDWCPCTFTQVVRQTGRCALSVLAFYHWSNDKFTQVQSLLTHPHVDGKSVLPNTPPCCPELGRGGVIFPRISIRSSLPFAHEPVEELMPERFTCAVKGKKKTLSKRTHDSFVRFVVFFSLKPLSHRRKRFPMQLWF